MQSLLIHSAEPHFLLRILSGSFQALDSLKDQIALHLAQFIISKSSLDWIDPRSVFDDHNEVKIRDSVVKKKDYPDGEGGSGGGAVFNALDTMLKDSLDRLKLMRESISWAHADVTVTTSKKTYCKNVNLIRSLCLGGKLHAALSLWRNMVSKSAVPDIITHNYLVNALCKRGDLEGAEGLVRHMLRQGPSPTCATYNTLMNGYCLMNDMDRALDIFSTMSNHGIIPNKVSCNILVHALCEKGLLEDASRLLKKILADDIEGEATNLIASTMIMDSYFKTGNMVEALICRDEVYQKSVEVDVVAYNVSVHGFCLSGDIDLVYKDLCHMFKSGYLPDVFTHNTLIGMLLRAGRSNEACNIYDSMLAMGVPPDHITYKIIIQGLCNNGYVVRANDFLGYMMEDCMVPEPLIWNTLIHGYGRYGNVKNAYSMRNKMIVHGILPNTYTYNALIYAQIRNGNFDEAQYLKKEMLLNGLVPDVVTYNLLIGATFHVGNITAALCLHDEMLRRGCAPDIITYTELIKSYCLHNQLKEAEQLLYKVLGLGLQLDHVPFLILMKKYWKMKELDKAYDLYQIWLKLEK